MFEKMPNKPAEKITIQGLEYTKVDDKNVTSFYNIYPEVVEKLRQTELSGKGAFIFGVNQSKVMIRTEKGYFVGNTYYGLDENLTQEGYKEVK